MAKPHSGDVEPFSCMKDTMDFETMVRRGLGRAVIYARESNVSIHRDFLLDACLNAAAYDAAFAGEQSEYMADIIFATGEVDYYKRSLLAALAAPDEDRDPQVYYILARIADPEEDDVRTVLRGYLSEALTIQDYTEAEPLILFDGLSGFVFILEQFEGREISENHWWDVERLFKVLERKIGMKEAQAGLETAISEHPAYERYAKMIREKRQPQRSRRSTFAVPSYGEIAEHIALASGTPRYLLVRWGKEADEETVRKVASDFLTETDQSRFAHYFRFFQKRAFPLVLDKLFALSESDDSEIAWGAREALSKVTHPFVRDMALKTLQQMGDADQGVRLLIRNFQEGDWAIISEAVLREQSDDECHDLVSDVRDLFDAHPQPETKEVLLALYERGPCSLCRKSIVEKLQTLGPLPNWMIEECKCDAYECTRELVGAYTPSSE